MFSVASILALAFTASASPVLNTRQTAIPSNWTWHVSGWEGGCVRLGCYYNFNVTVPSVPNEIAGVTAYCNGQEGGHDSGFTTGSTYTSCQILEGVNNGVAAKFGPRNESDQSAGPETIFVSFELAGYEERPAYNFSGQHEAIYNALVAPLQEFDITPTAVFGVA